MNGLNLPTTAPAIMSIVWCSINLLHLHEMERDFYKIKVIFSIIDWLSYENKILQDKLGELEKDIKKYVCFNSF